MPQRRDVLRLATLAAGCQLLSPANTYAQTSASDPAHLESVRHTLERMQTVKPGMTRGDLLAVFTTEGGISTRRQRTYVSRDCPYFKVDVGFEPVDRAHSSEQSLLFAENNRDTITKLSKPYLAFFIAD